MVVLIINAGSATYKYSVFSGEKKIFSALHTKNGKEGFDKSIFKKFSFDAIGFRFVHGGHLFRETTLVTPVILRKLKQLDSLAPLHNPTARKLVELSQRLLPKVKKYLIFDTAFHATLPEQSWRYALPKKITDEYGLRRYGFHGIVCSSVVRQLKQKKKLQKKLIICHLGSGCSVTAVQDGKSIDTSMGFTPLEGLVMGTRAGDLDPGLVLELAQKMGAKKLREILNHQSGLKALTGTNDMRTILRNAQKNHSAALLALEIFTQKAAQVIADMSVSLGGIDLLTFSGGIGENSSLIRTMICEKLRHLGIRINTRRNKRAKAGENIHTLFSKTKICFLHADEESEMNRMAQQQLEN